MSKPLDAVSPTGKVGKIDTRVGPRVYWSYDSSDRVHDEILREEDLRRFMDAQTKAKCEHEDVDWGTIEVQYPFVDGKLTESGWWPPAAVWQDGRCKHCKKMVRAKFYMQKPEII